MEFALTLPILMVMFLGVIDFGRAFYAGVLVEQAAREGARVGMGALPGSEIGTTEIATVVANSLSYGTNCSGGCPNYLALQAQPAIDIGGYQSDGTPYGRVNGSGTNAVCPRNNVSCDGGQVIVKVSFNVPLLTEFLLSRLGFSSIPVSAEARAAMW